MFTHDAECTFDNVAGLRAFLRAILSQRQISSAATELENLSNCHGPGTCSASWHPLRAESANQPSARTGEHRWRMLVRLKQHKRKGAQ